MLICIETHNIELVIFQGGGGGVRTPYPPLDLHLKHTLRIKLIINIAFIYFTYNLVLLLETVNPKLFPESKSPETLCYLRGHMINGCLHT